MMMTFCKKSVFSVLGLTATTTDNSINSDCNKAPYKHKEGLGLIITTTAETDRPPNVIESSLLKLSSSSSPQTPPPPPFLSMFEKKDPGGVGFIDLMGSGVNGLMSCTESLGFESSDEINVKDDNYTRVDLPTRAEGRKNVSEKRQLKKFPPPLSSFNRNGQPSFFLRSVRTDGRLELTEVRIDRQEILRASRQDGRLRLHLINEEEEEQEEQEQEEEEEEEEEEEIQQQQQQQLEAVEEEAEKDEERIEGWPFKGELSRRCNEVRIENHHHHNNLHLWRQHCVTTR